MTMEGDLQGLKHKHIFHKNKLVFFAFKYETHNYQNMDIIFSYVCLTSNEIFLNTLLKYELFTFEL